KFGPFSLDLFADDHNTKCDNYYTAEDNAMAQRLITDTWVNRGAWQNELLNLK
ncbi:phage N-6-adenine-methyltransferase, partial [Erwinia tracheiphila PSU-1]